MNILRLMHQLDREYGPFDPDEGAGAIYYMLRQEVLDRFPGRVTEGIVRRYLNLKRNRMRFEDIDELDPEYVDEPDESIEDDDDIGFDDDDSDDDSDDDFEDDDDFDDFDEEDNDYFDDDTTDFLDPEFDF